LKLPAVQLLFLFILPKKGSSLEELREPWLCSEWQKASTMTRRTAKTVSKIPTITPPLRGHPFPISIDTTGEDEEDCFLPELNPEFLSDSIPLASQILEKFSTGFLIFFS
jgi:hypothetical protein